MENLKKLVQDARYEEAYNGMAHMALDERWDFISTDMYDEEPLVTYTFLLYMVSQDINEAECHFYCYLFLAYLHPFFDDAMRLAMWHLKCAIALQPDSLEYKKQVISIGFTYPVHYFEDEEYRRYSKDVLDEEPGNVDAKEALRKLGG